MSHIQTSSETPPQMTQHAMLVIWGIYARRLGLVQAIEAVKLKQKRRDHTPQTKVLEFLVAILAGLPYLQDISRSAHPLDQDQMVAEAWGRDAWADYSGVSRTLSRLTTAEVAELATALDRISQPFIDREVALALEKQGEIVYDADLTGRPVSSTSSSYPNTAFGHMGDAIELGYQAALVSLHSPTYGRLWLANELHPGNTVSMTRTQALVVAAEKRTGHRPQRRTDLLGKRLAQAQAELEAIGDAVADSCQRHREAQGKLDDARLSLREWEQEVRILAVIYEQKNRQQTAHCQLTRAQRKVATFTKRIPRCEKALGVAQWRLTRHEAQVEAIQAKVDQLQQIVPLEWYDRYETRIEESGLPRKKKDRKAWVEAVGNDGIYLLTSIYESKTHHWLWEVSAVQILRQVWLHQFYHQDGELKLRLAKELPPASTRFASPYDPEAHYSTKRDTHWTGYKVHITETCDDDRPHLITCVETTMAPQPDIGMAASIHEALAEKDCLPDTHLTDTGYIDAEQIVDSQEKYGVNLVGPMRPDTSWQMKANVGYASKDFQVDWDAQTVICPQSIASSRWTANADPWGNDVIQVRFPPGECRQCEARSLCTRSITGPRFLTLRQRTVHEALQNARQQQQTDEWQEQYAKRAGIEGTISQAIRGFGLRECRYIGLAKTHLQHVLTATAINLARLDAWFTGKKRAVTRTSRFAALRPLPA